MINLAPAVSEKIAQLLNTSGMLSDDRFTKITTQCAENKEKIIDELIKKKFISEDDIAKVISRNFAIKKIELSADKIKPEVIKILPNIFIKNEKIIPFEIEGNVLKVAIADPSKIVLMTKIKALANKNISFFATTFSNIQKVLDSRILDAKVQDQLDKKKALVKKKQKDSQAKKNLDEVKKKLDKVDDVSTTNVVNFVDTMFFQALRIGASDLHIEKFKNDVARVRFRIDGIMKIQEGLNEQLEENYQAVVTRLKIMAGCDISEQRLPQDGGISIIDEEQGGIDVDVRFNTVPTKFGERIVMRLLRSTNVMPLDKIGIPPDELKKFVKAIESPQGMILVTGPTGSGKTTTLYAALQHINKPELNVLTAEDPVEYTMEGIGQIQANEGIGLSFANILRAFLRQDPEVILVGEIRDKETVDIAIKAALTGHLLLSTHHTRDAISTIIRLTNMEVPSFMIAGALNTVVAQRLARRICPTCKMIDETIKPKQLEEIGFNKEEAKTVKIYKGAGCSECSGGYRGRQGIYEILEISKEIAGAIVDDKRASELLDLAKKQGFRTMDEIARDFMVKGIISYEEFLRTISLAS